MFKRIIRIIMELWRGYSDKELLYICSNIYKEYARLIGLEDDLRTTSRRLKISVTRRVCGERLYNKLMKYRGCPTCLAANNNCNKCLLLPLWKKGRGGSEEYPCCYSNSPYVIAIDAHNKYTIKQRKEAARKISTTAREIAYRL